MAALFPAHPYAQATPGDAPPLPPLERAAATAGVDIESWRQRREELGLGLLGVVEGSPDPGARVLVIERLREAGLLGAERALLAELAAEDSLSAETAAAWDVLLRDAENAGADELYRRVARRVWADAGSLAAALPDECLPQRSRAAAMTALVAVELATPWYRPRAPTERAPEPAPDADHALQAAIALLGPAPASAPPSPPPDACDDTPALLAALVHASSEEFARVGPALTALAATRSLPARLLVRPAVAAYVRADASALETLAALTGGTHDGAYIAGLLAAMQPDPAAQDAARSELRPPTSAVEHWIYGELERRAGRWDSALEHLERAIQDDPLFAPALISRASALVSAGRAPDALADLHHIRLTYPGPSPYRELIDALERRLR